MTLLSDGRRTAITFTFLPADQGGGPPSTALVQDRHTGSTCRFNAHVRQRSRYSRGSRGAAEAFGEKVIDVSRRVSARPDCGAEPRRRPRPSPAARRAATDVGQRRSDLIGRQFFDQAALVAISTHTKSLKARALASGQIDVRSDEPSRRRPSRCGTTLERGANVGQNATALASTGHQQTWPDGL